MENYFNYMADHWWVGSWMTFWFLLFGYAIIMGLKGLTVRFFRVIKVLSRGWPPDHLDADGDWRPHPPVYEDEKPEVEEATKEMLYD